MSLATQYLGLSLKNPLIASAAPANAELDHLRRVEDAGAAAVVLPSLFQEQIEAEAALHDSLRGWGSYNSPEVSSYFPELISGPYGVGPDAYLGLVRRAKAALSIPVIASLNGTTKEGWIEYATLLQQAGADAIELNMYMVPVDMSMSGQAIEDRYVAIVDATRRAVDIPLAVKLSPYASALGNLARRLQENGADGLVLFNRLLQPEIDLTTLRVTEGIHLSTNAEMALPLSWIALLAAQTEASLAASGGVEGADDVVKFLLAGADVVMTTSALIRHGAGHLTVLLGGLRGWMETRHFDSVSDLRGLMSRAKSTRKDVYGRPSYIKMLNAGVAS
jgi:dihydroorotate dehydrogenase (fumarate)